MIPAVPSGSYLAEGFVMSSIDSIAEAGIEVRTSELLMPSSPVGLPSTRKLILLLPRSITVPSISTVTDGIFSRTSSALPPLAAMF